jgi:hypothetical protein
MMRVATVAPLPIFNAVCLADLRQKSTAGADTPHGFRASIPLRPRTCDVAMGDGPVLQSRPVVEAGLRSRLTNPCHLADEKWLDLFPGFDAAA